MNHPGLWVAPEKALQHQPKLAPTNTKFELMLQAITELPQTSNKWVTIIGNPTHMEARQFLGQLEQAGINKSRIRWIRTRDEDTAVWAAEQAMLIGNSELVIAWLGQCQGRNYRRASLAAKVSPANTFLFTDNELKTPLH